MTDTTLSRENRLAIVILAVAQSALLLFLHKSVTNEFWPASDTQWLIALYTLAIGLPLFLFIGTVDWRDRTNLIAAAVLGGALFWLGWHAGWVHPEWPMHFGLACSVPIAIFIAAFLFRTWRETGHLAYRGLLGHSWGNALTLGFLVLFLGAFWLLLTLWGLLFSIIGIEFFDELFREPEFAYPVYGLVGGWGIGLIRARIGFIATVRHLCEALTRALLPLAAFIVLAFTATLPFTGITVLLESDRAGALELMWLAAIYLFFFNAAIAEEGERNIWIWLHRLGLLALVLLPVIIALAMWAMWLRIDQYGLSLSRLWGLFVIAYLAAFSLSYVGVLARFRGMKIESMRTCNTVLGVALAVSLVLVQLPVMDFKRLAANNQAERLLQGRTDPDNFDARYIRFSLGTYGQRQLEMLLDTEFVAERAAVQTRIQDALAAENYWSQRPVDDSREGLIEQLTPLPGTELDEAFLDAVRERSSDGGHPCGIFYHPGGTVDTSCMVGDLHHNEQHYRILLPAARELSHFGGRAWRRQGEAWTSIGDVRVYACGNESVDAAPLVVTDEEFFVFSDGQCRMQILPDGPPSVCNRDLTGEEVVHQCPRDADARRDSLG